MVKLDWRKMEGMGSCNFRVYVYIYMYTLALIHDKEPFLQRVDTNDKERNCLYVGKEFSLTCLCISTFRP